MGQSNIKLDEPLSETYNPIYFPKLVVPKDDTFNHQFEKDYLMTLNLFRSCPKRFKKFIKYYKPKYEEFKDEKVSTSRCCETLGDYDFLRQVTFNSMAMKACRMNNESIPDDGDPKDPRMHMYNVNGNIEIYKNQFEIPHNRKDDKYKEFCINNFQGSPTELIAYQLQLAFKWSTH